MVAILMISAKLATLDPLKIKIFWNKVYDIIIPVHDVTNKILSRDSNDVLDAVCDQCLLTLAFLWENLS